MPGIIILLEDVAKAVTLHLGTCVMALGLTTREAQNAPPRWESCIVIENFHLRKSTVNQARVHVLDIRNLTTWCGNPLDKGF